LDKKQKNCLDDLNSNTNITNMSDYQIRRESYKCKIVKRDFKDFESKKLQDFCDATYNLCKMYVEKGEGSWYDCISKSEIGN